MAPSQCVMHSLSKGILEVKCRNSSAAAAASRLGLEGVDDEDDLSMSGSSNVYWLQLYNADTGVLLRNMSNKAGPQFTVSGIDPESTRVAAVITTANRQGRSESVTLEGAVERAVGSRAGKNIFHLLNFSSLKQNKLFRNFAVQHVYVMFLNKKM